MSTQTPQTDADVRISELEEIYRAHVRDIVGLRTENDRLKALCEELKGALMKMTGWADYLNDCDSWYAQQQPGNGITEDIAEARAALKKAQKDI